MDICLRTAFPNESDRLTEIAFAAKRTWDYPESYFQLWEKELTISTDYIRQNTVVAALWKEKIIGFYSITLLVNDTHFGNILVKKGYWLEHLFIDPTYQHKGIGTSLLKHALEYCNNNWIDDLTIFVDPNATGFYEKMGAKFIENSPSSIPGRLIPVYGYQFEN